MMKKMLTVLLMIMLCTGLIPGAMAEQASGITGEVNWRYDASTHTLTIYGTGAMGNTAASAPWSSYQNDIAAVIIEEGVTSIGNYAFYDCLSLTTVSIPSSVVVIGHYAFYRCASLTTVEYWGIDKPTAGSNVFGRSSLLFVAVLTNYTSDSFAGLDVYHVLSSGSTEPAYTITATAGVGGTVTGGGTYDKDASVTVTAAPESGYQFVDWTENGSVVSTDASYTFTASTDRTLTANFKLLPTLTVEFEPNNQITTEGDIQEALLYQVKVSDGSTASYQWYQCDDANRTNARALEGANRMGYDLPKDLTAGCTSAARTARAACCTPTARCLNCAWKTPAQCRRPATTPTSPC